MASSSERTFVGTSELAQRMREFDWTQTSIGIPRDWPDSLKTAVQIMLTSRQPMWIGCGDALTYLYNDPYKSIIGGKHPWALGRPAAEVWSEIWDDIGPMLATALAGDEGTYVEAQLLIMERNGYKEETYYTFSYSPITNHDGSASGIICANTDDTQRVIGERQLALLRNLAAGTAEARSWQQACERSAEALKSNPYDLPFAMIYMSAAGGGALSLAGTSGIERGHPAVPTSVVLNAPSVWPFSEVLGKTELQLVTGLSTTFSRELPAGAWAQVPDQAAVLPIPATGETGRAGAVIVGLNPFRLFDDNYRSFLNLVAGQIAAVIGNAEAYENERRRAEALAELDRAKTVFFSNVSHEFRTPLTLMLGPLEEVLAKPVDHIPADNRALVATAHRNAVRLLKLVNSLLDFSRIEAGRMEASYAPVDLAALTAELASNFRSAIDRAGLRLIVDCEALPEPVYVDHNMWEKVVLNLLSNAFKYTFEGEIAVMVKASADGRRAQFTVRDTGIGISASELPHLFERFHRVEGARGRSFEGSGIGLALVQELVKLHGGEIWVVSEIGKGSTFCASIPFGVAHLPPRSVVAAPSMLTPAVRTQAYVGEAPNWSFEATVLADGVTHLAAEDLHLTTIVGAQQQLILIVDDNADMRHYIHRLLRSSGFQVKTAEDGEAGLEVARRFKPDLIISDVMMPKLDGFELVARLRQDPRLQEIPVLLLSARAGEEEKLSGLRSGADDYLIKPFSARELLARVEGNLLLAKARGETARLLKEEAKSLELLHRASVAIAAELDLERVVQLATDAATEIAGAAFGSFFYQQVDDGSDNKAMRSETFSKRPMPRDPILLAPTFGGETIVRSADIAEDPRFGFRRPADRGRQIRSYLAAAVISRSGDIIGGLCVGHAETAVFNERSERLVASIANLAAIAIDKARLYQEAQHEIEERKRTEAALRESELTLEIKVAERTAQLLAANDHLLAEAAERERAEQALRHAQKLEGIGHLTGGVAHDFNNLLTVIIGNLEVLQRHLQDAAPDIARLARSTNNAIRGAKRAETLTQRLLAFARQQPLDPKPVDVGRLVSGMSDLLHRTIGEQIAVETVLAGALWRVNADPNQLEVAILNLAVNARDAMPNGGKLTIETGNMHLDEAYAADQIEVVPGQYVVITITDTGFGMTKETMSQAFEPFFTTKDVGHGTGLGLSQVYGFVKQSGGNVKINSELGQGTSVKIYLPRYHSEEEIVGAEPAMIIPRGRKTETILMVEDDEDVRNYTRESLHELGYRVLEAANGRIALELIRRHPEVDLMFTDVGLPGGMNGRQIADQARRLKSSLKVLFTTGYARDAIVRGGRLDPGVELLPKPFTFQALAAKLRDILDASRKPPCILVVEDEVLVQMLVTEILEEEGFNVELAGSATAATSKLRLVNGRVDAALIDIGLPDQKGDALAAELRKAHSALPIVLATGYEEADLRERFKGQPLIAFLHKPYSAEQLRDALATIGVAAPGTSSQTLNAKIARTLKALD